MDGHHTNTPAAPAPLWAVLAFSFLNSGAAGVVSSMVFVITQNAYEFNRTQNYGLAVLIGIVYIIGATAAGPLLRTLSRAVPGFSRRAALMTLTMLMGMICLLPLAALKLGPTESGTPAAWPMWLAVALYNMLNGMFWPQVEAFVAGGRHGNTLRRTLGIWNVTWSGALVIAALVIAPLMATAASAQWALPVFAGVHALSLLVLFAFPQIPAAHHLENAEPKPAVYKPLLATFQLLLPMSYVVGSALSPYIPAAAAKMNFSPSQQALAVIAWLGPRCLGFLFYERWRGWHGRWSMPIIGTAGLLIGFACAVLSPRLGIDGSAAGFLLGLGLFGVGMATIYTGAIYYAMEVGNAEVDAGGRHEALIGVGYTLGPLFGLLASLAIDAKRLGPEAFEPVVLSIVTLVALGTAIHVLRTISRVRMDSAR